MNITKMKQGELKEPCDLINAVNDLDHDEAIEVNVEDFKAISLLRYGAENQELSTNGMQKFLQAQLKVKIEENGDSLRIIKPAKRERMRYIDALIIVLSDQEHFHLCSDEGERSLERKCLCVHGEDSDGYWNFIGKIRVGVGSGDSIDPEVDPALEDMLGKKKHLIDEYYDKYYQEEGE